MFARLLADALTAFADSVDRDPTSAQAEDACAGALKAFTAALQPAEQPEPATPPPTPSAPPATLTSVPPAAPSAQGDGAGEPSPVPTLYKCPQCGGYFTAPATCSNQHEPAETVTLDEVPAPPADATAEDAAPAAGPGSPDWPAGS